jgi:hypothetical protein
MSDLGKPIREIEFEPLELPLPNKVEEVPEEEEVPANE